MTPYLSVQIMRAENGYVVTVIDAARKTAQQRSYLVTGDITVGQQIDAIMVGDRLDGSNAQAPKKAAPPDSVTVQDLLNELNKL